MSKTRTNQPALILAILLGALPLCYPGLFHASTDLLPKRLFLYLGSAVLCLTWLTQNRTSPKVFLLSNLTRATSIYLVWNILSLLWATNAFSGFVESIQLLVVFMVFLYVSTQDIRSHLQTIGFTTTLGGLIVSLIGIAQYAGLGFDTIPSVGLPSSTFIFRNLAAAYLVGAIPLTLLTLYLSDKSYHKNLCLISLSAMLLYLFYTRTRGAWFAFASALIVLGVGLLLSPHLRQTYKETIQSFNAPQMRWISILSVALLIGGLLLPAQTSERAIQQFDEQKATPMATVKSLVTPGSDRGRFTMWRHSLSMFTDHPILGVGLDNWEYIYPRYDRGEKITADSEPVRPHNDLLWIASELGIIGLIAYLSLLLFATQYTYQSLKQIHGREALIALLAFCGLTGLIVYGLFSFPKEQPTTALLFWFYLGIINKTPSNNTPKNQPLIPLVGLLICLGATYTAIRHIQFDQQYQTARSYEMRKQWPQAYQAINTALDAGTFDHRAAFLKAQYLQKMNRLDESIYAYQQALEKHPNYAHTHHNLGGVYAARGNLNAAISHLKMALKIRPSYYQAQLHLGNAYVATKQYPLAVQTFQDILKQKPNSAEAYTNLGAVYLQQNHFSNAILMFEKALEIQPSNAQAYNNLGYAYEQAGQIAKAITAYENLLKNWQGDAEYRQTVLTHVANLRQKIQQP